MQVTSASGVSQHNRDENIENTANDVLGKLPEILWDVKILRAESEEIGPTRIVLFQELERFNKLIEKIKETLINLKRALRG
jgi:dynein heavy chain